MAQEELQLHSCSLASPRLSAGKETEDLSQAFLGLWCSPKRDYVLPECGLAGAEGRKIIPSRSPAAQGQGWEEKDIIFLLLQPLIAVSSCSNDGGCRHAFQTSASEISSPAGQVPRSLYQHLSHSLFLNLL